MSQSASARFAGYRFPPEIISHAVCFYFRPSLSLLSLRMIEEMLAALVHKSGPAGFGLARSGRIRPLPRRPDA